MITTAKYDYKTHLQLLRQHQKNEEEEEEARIRKGNTKADILCVLQFKMALSKKDQSL